MRHVRVAPVPDARHARAHRAGRTLGQPADDPPGPAVHRPPYWLHLHAFFAWLVAEGAISASPAAHIAAPLSRPDQVQSLSDRQAAALLAAAARTLHPTRDEAVLTLLLDTGLRASELCALRARDLDLQARRLAVMGKGFIPICVGQTAVWTALLK